MNKWKSAQTEKWSFVRAEGKATGVLHILQTTDADIFLVIYDDFDLGPNPTVQMTKTQVEGNYGFVFDQRKGFIVKGE